MKKHVLLYDGECPMCVFQMKVLGWLDWRGALAPVPLADPLAHRLAPRLGREDLLEAIHCVTPEGCVYRGARAIRFVGMRLPLLVPVALVLWVPGVIVIAEIIYRWVSRHRLLFSPLFGCREACAVPPARRREQDKPA